MKHTVGVVTYHGPLAEVAARTTPEMWAYYRLVDSVSDQIAEFMERGGITRTALAAKLGVSKANVTKILAGDANLTLKTLARVLTALDADITVDIRPLGTGARSARFRDAAVPPAGPPARLDPLPQEAPPGPDPAACP